VEVVLLGDPGAKEMAEHLRVVHETYLPSRLVAGGNPEKLPPLPLFEGRTPIDGRATAYVCRGFTCTPPIHEPDKLAQELAAAAPEDAG
jgi:hypothetical protein